MMTDRKPSKRNRHGANWLAVIVFGAAFVLLNCRVYAVPAKANSPHSLELAAGFPVEMCRISAVVEDDRQWMWLWTVRANTGAPATVRWHWGLLVNLLAAVVGGRGGVVRGGTSVILPSRWPNRLGLRCVGDHCDLLVYPAVCVLAEANSKN